MSLSALASSSRKPLSTQDQPTILMANYLVFNLNRSGRRGTLWTLSCCPCFSPRRNVEVGVWGKSGVKLAHGLSGERSSSWGI